VSHVDDFPCLDVSHDNDFPWLDVSHVDDIAAQHRWFGIGFLATGIPSNGDESSDRKKIRISSSRVYGSRQSARTLPGNQAGCSKCEQQ
jgi:hypothetical protein